ncbi:MAG TPA: DUF1844 domain-containing protein [Kofleriaceae bacterium]|nr:DUF1844 domain-containing protein [Kofleriaceae bacterium]
MSDTPPAAPSFALGPVDFSTHILSLASSAMVSLGELPAPGEEQPAELDLESAKHLIDVLAMLEVKTKGNLDEAEQKVLASLIYDLRLKFVDARRRHGR